MSSDLIAWVVALTLGIVVVVLGLRRNLSEITRNGLPRFERAPAQATAMLPPGGGESDSRLRHSEALAHCVLALVQAASAALSSQDRLLHAGTAALSPSVRWCFG